MVDHRLSLIVFKGLFESSRDSSAFLFCGTEVPVSIEGTVKHNGKKFYQCDIL